MMNEVCCHKKRKNTIFVRNLKYEQNEDSVFGILRTFGRKN